MQRANATALKFDERLRTSEKSSLLTPARQAGLDALEREFSELLAAYRGQRAQPDVAA